MIAIDNNETLPSKRILDLMYTNNTLKMKLERMKYERDCLKRDVIRLTNDNIKLRAKYNEN